MRISDSEIKKVMLKAHEGTPTFAIVEEILEIGVVAEKKQDQKLVKEVVEAVKRLPDREDVIAELRARIEAGAYNPTAEDITDAMIRRAIADRVR